MTLHLLSITLMAGLGILQPTPLIAAQQTESPHPGLSTLTSPRLTLPDRYREEEEQKYASTPVDLSQEATSWDRLQSPIPSSPEPSPSHTPVLSPEHKAEKIGKIRPGINLQGYCTNYDGCLAASRKLAVWVNLELKKDKTTSKLDLDPTTRHLCPSCKSKNKSVQDIHKVRFCNAEYTITANGQQEKGCNYEQTYTLDFTTTPTYHLTAAPIRQHAKNLEDLIERSRKAMGSPELQAMLEALEKYKLTIAKPDLKGDQRLRQKIETDYKGDFNQVFDIGRFTLLCADETQLQAAVEVVKRAPEFKMIVAEDKDFFDKPSKTHHRFHNIKLYLAPQDVYVEMQATLHRFTTLEHYSQIDNPKLSHDFYEHIRAWKPQSEVSKRLKAASDQTLQAINDILCEWIDKEEIEDKAKKCQPAQGTLVNFTPTAELEQMGQALCRFVYTQLNAWNPLAKDTAAPVQDDADKQRPLPSPKDKALAIYHTLFEFYKKEILRSEITTLAAMVTHLQRVRSKEVTKDTTTAQGLSLYVPLQAADALVFELEKAALYDLHAHICDHFLAPQGKLATAPLLLLQGNSGAGKSLYGRYLEQALWKSYQPGKRIPLFISLPRAYKKGDTPLVTHALQLKGLSQEAITMLRTTNTPCLFIFDGFDEVKHIYDEARLQPRAFYDRFQLAEWPHAKALVTCRSQILSDVEAGAIFTVGSQRVPQVWLAPFSQDKVATYIEHFVKYGTERKQKAGDPEPDKDKSKAEQAKARWDVARYKSALESFPGLSEMVREPFSLGLILNVLPDLAQEERSAEAQVTRAQLYTAFSNQWFERQITRLLRSTQMPRKRKMIRRSFETYSQDLAFEMLMQGTQAITQPAPVESDDEETGQAVEADPDPGSDPEEGKVRESKSLQRAVSQQENNPAQAHAVWQCFFEGDDALMNLQGSPLRSVGDREYMFIHKSYQEYFAAQKMIQEVVRFKAPTKQTKKFDTYFAQAIASDFSLNRKLLSGELAIIHFMADRVHEIDKRGTYRNLQSRLFRIIEASKSDAEVRIAAANAATILNAAGVGFAGRNWRGVQLAGAILDGAVLEHTDLSGANLQRTSLVQAALTGATLRKAQLHGVHFGEYAFLEGHTGVITSICFSPDGQLLASGSHDATVRLWQPAKGQLLSTCEGHTDSITDIQFSPDGCIVASASDDKTIRLWDAKAGQQLYVCSGHEASIKSIDFSPDSTSFVSGSADSTMRLWDRTSGRELKLCMGHTSGINKVQFSPEGSMVASASTDNTIGLWDITTGNFYQLKGHVDSVNSVQFSGDGKLLASASQDNTVRLWNVEQRCCLYNLQAHTAKVNAALFAPDDEFLISASDDGSLCLWDVSQGALGHILQGHPEAINCIEFCGISNILVSAADDKSLHIWDMSQRLVLRALKGHFSAVLKVKCSKDGKILASTASEKIIRIWNVAAARSVNLQRFPGHIDGVADVSFSSDSKMIASASLDKNIVLWNTKEGAKIKAYSYTTPLTTLCFSADDAKIASGSLENIVYLQDLKTKDSKVLQKYKWPIESVRFSADNKLLACAFAFSIVLWEVEQARVLRTLQSDGTAVNHSVHFSPDNKLLASGSSDQGISLWDVEQGMVLKKLEGHTEEVNSVCFSPDGQLLASGSSDQTIRLWNLSQGTCMKVLEGHNKSISCVCFAPDGTCLASASDDKTICLWDANEFRLVRTLHGHTAGVNTISFSPNGQYLASGSKDKTIRLWQFSSERFRKALRKALQGSHSPQASPTLLDDLTEVMMQYVGIPVWLQPTVLWIGGAHGLLLQQADFSEAQGLQLGQKALIRQRGGLVTNSQTEQPEEKKAEL